MLNICKIEYDGVCRQYVWGRGVCLKVLCFLSFATTGRALLSISGLTIQLHLGWSSYWAPLGLEWPNQQTNALFGQCR